MSQITKHPKRHTLDNSAMALGCIYQQKLACLLCCPQSVLDAKPGTSYTGQSVTSQRLESNIRLLFTLD